MDDLLSQSLVKIKLELQSIVELTDKQTFKNLTATHKYLSAKI